MGSSFHHASGGDKVRALRSLLDARGMDEHDFEMREEANSGISQLMGLGGGILTLRRRSTGELRVYACGPGSAWFAAISTDLDRGYFRSQRPSHAIARPKARPPAARRS